MGVGVFSTVHLQLEIRAKYRLVNIFFRINNLGGFISGPFIFFQTLGSLHGMITSL
jgi:hypothetical protein